MSVEVMRTVSLMASVWSLSLFSTIVAFAAPNVAGLRWDGSFCTARGCYASTVTARAGPSRAGAHALPRLAVLAPLTP